MVRGHVCMYTLKPNLVLFITDADASLVNHFCYLYKFIWNKMPT